MVRIGNITLREHPLFLAPMEDITDPSFRYICKKFDADFVYTEFISSDGLTTNGQKSLKKLDIFNYERPIGIQLYGHLIEPMIEAAKIAEASNPDLIDLNFGCPVRKIAQRGAGAGMLNNIPLMMEMTRQLVKNVNLPVTWPGPKPKPKRRSSLLDIALQLQDTGIQALTIHGRTRNQLYKGKADWTLIGAVKNHPNIQIPIIGNGDVDSPEIAKEMFEKFGVDGIMIGRAIVGQPWLFREIRHFIDTGKKLPPISLSEKIKIAKLHFEKSLEFKGEPRGIFEMRRHFANYFKGLPDFKPIRVKLLTSLNPGEIFDLLETIDQTYPNY